MTGNHTKTVAFIVALSNSEPIYKCRPFLSLSVTLVDLKSRSTKVLKICFEKMYASLSKVLAKHTKKIKKIIF